ncbi:MAG TPA: 23S rRNA (adenine(2503)-C(2))-methyltransferase RlmN [Phycisphaerales bacterium]|nr:23S rRNA (adenine(2503)-C(2))-methyltransferase RlmN [Phycisphaerales bacterium]
MNAPATKPNPLGLTSDEFVRLYSGSVLVGRLGGVPGALEAYRTIFREGVCDLPGANVPAVRVSRVLREDSPEGEVVKFLTHMPKAPEMPAGSLFRLPVASAAPEDLAAESVLIPMTGSKGETTYTLCLSSQVGCAMGCGFCETAQMGLIRSLLPHEIVAQWFAAVHVVGVRPRNIVFMGMGEPFDNYDNVIRAVAVLKDHNGPHMGVSRITISTVGRVDGIRRLAEQIKEPGWHRLGLALSLNAPNDELRERLMPVNKRWKLADVQRALVEWPKFAGNKLCVEYVLIPGVNDAREHAVQIAEFLRPFGVHKSVTGDATNKLRAVLNLIPYNPRRDSPWPAPGEDEVERFMGWLVEEGVFVKRRRTKGRRMMGACGQLGSEEIRARRAVAR